jgi:uncharacterized protein (TIGR00369 family)
MPKALERLQRMVSGAEPQAPVNDLVGFRLTGISDGRAVVEMDTDERHANPMGTVQGGVLCAVVDAAMGLAAATTLADDESFTTLELKINYLKPLWKSKLRAEGRVVKRGRTVSLTECEVWDESGSLVAHATSTCLTLRGDQAQGRGL